MSDLQVVEENPLVQYQSMSLKGLVEHKNDILQIVAENGGELGENMEEILDMADALMERKVDNVAIMVKSVIPSHIAACKEQIARLQDLETRIKDLTIEAIQDSGGTQLDGLAYRARVQNNPAKIVVDNPDQVPLMFRRGTVTITAKVDPSDADAVTYWKNLIQDHEDNLGEAFSGQIVFEPDLKAMKEVMAPPKPKNKGETAPEPMAIDGARVEQGVHVRYEAAKAKAKKVTAKKEKK